MAISLRAYTASTPRSMGSNRSSARSRSRQAASSPSRSICRSRQCPSGWTSSPRRIVVASGPLAAAETVSNTQTQWLAPGGSVQSALRLLSSVIATPAGESINGGRPDQAGFQIGASSLVDPSTNLARIWLPTDGVDSVAVLTNPYEAEFGRFSSGLVVVQTRRAADRWKFGVNNTIPNFRTKRYTVADIVGIGSVKPSLELGGPIVPGTALSRADRTVPLGLDRRPQPARKRAEDDAVVRIVDAPGCQPLGPPHAGRDRRFRAERRRPGHARHVHAACRYGEHVRRQSAMRW